MKVTEVTSAAAPQCHTGNIIQEQLQHEFNFLRAEQITKTMLKRGLITPDEYRLIMMENLIAFPTFISSIF